MKIKKFIILFLVPLLALIVIIMRLTHTISSSTFGTMGFILGTLEFLGSLSSDTLSKEVHPITDLKEYFNPIKKRYDYFTGYIIFIGILLLVILILIIFGHL